jgi:hypothetical protein
MIIHVLPGDAIVEEFSRTGLEGQVAVCREALVDGPVNAEGLHDLWNLREEYFAETDPDAENSYGQHIVAEFGKLIELPASSEVNLWFEYELFCQVNMWFCLYILRETKAEVYRVAPSVRADGDIWKGFGGLGADLLRKCHTDRQKLEREDISLGSELWQAHRTGNGDRLRSLSTTPVIGFPFLKEVCEAEVVKAFRPKEILREIIDGGLSDFQEVFQAFSDRAGVYGYGDSQVKQILATL